MHLPYVLLLSLFVSISLFSGAKCKETRVLARFAVNSDSSDRRSEITELRDTFDDDEASEEATTPSVAYDDEDVKTTLNDDHADEPLPYHFAFSGDRQKNGQTNRPNVYTSNEYNLYSTLLLKSNYSKNVRPVPNHLDPIIVKVGMCVMMIEDLIERDQTMVMSACVKMFWVDEYLRWDPLQFGNLTWLALGSQSIWLPDIAIVNSPEPHALTRKLTNIGVSYRGEVGFFPSGRLATRCNLIITYFPFDWQNCEVRFESWIYPTKYLEIQLYPGDEAIDVKEYYDNFQWSLKSFRVEIDVVNYDGKNFSSLTVIFRLRRKPAFYFMYFIFPQLLLAALQTLSHTLPVEHPGRMAMLTALFIGTSVTHAGIAAHIPKSSDTMSLLQVYMTIMSVNLVAALVITFVMLYTVLRYPKREPSFFSMMAAFFSIIWPKLGSSEDEPTTLLYQLNSRYGQNVPSRRVGRVVSRRRTRSRGRGYRTNKLLKNIALETADNHKYSYDRDDLLLAAKAAKESLNFLGDDPSVHNWNRKRRASAFSDSSFFGTGENPIVSVTSTVPNHTLGNNGVNNNGYEAEGEVDDEEEDEIVDFDNDGANMTAVPAVENEDYPEDETVVWQPNPDYHCTKGATPVIQINGVTYYDCAAEPTDADFDCAYFRGGETGEEVLPIITNTNKHPKYIPPDDERLFSENPGFVLPLKKCKTCECRTKISNNNYGAILPSVDKIRPRCHSGGDKQVCNKFEEMMMDDKTPFEIDDEEFSTTSQSIFRRISTHKYANPYDARRNDSFSNNRNRRHGSTRGRRVKRMESTSSMAAHSGDGGSSSASGLAGYGGGSTGGAGGTPDESDLKRRWLMYCVALDKSIMYVNGCLNVIVPLVLFSLMPWLHDISHADHETD